MGMKTQDMSYDAALIRLRMKRKCVPNIGFECQLRKFQQKGNNTDPSLYRDMNIQTSLSEYIKFLCDRVPKLRILLQSGSKVAEELLMISLHLHQVMRYDFDQVIRKKIAVAIERLRDIQRNLVANHRSLREFNKLFPKKEFEWAREYLVSDGDESPTNSTGVGDKEGLNNFRKDSAGTYGSSMIIQGDSQPDYKETIQMAPLADKSQPLRLTMPEERKSPSSDGSAPNTRTIEIQRHQQVKQDEELGKVP